LVVLLTGVCTLAALVGAYAILVDAKDEKSKLFYERYGFIPCVDAQMTLYLPLGCA
jgi:hypothetical protein